MTPGQISLLLWILGIPALLWLILAAWNWLVPVPDVEYDEYDPECQVCGDCGQPYDDDELYTCGCRFSDCCGALMTAGSCSCCGSDGKIEPVPPCPFEGVHTGCHWPNCVCPQVPS